MVKNKYAYLLLLPTYLLVGGFLLYPTYEAFRMSLLDWSMADYLQPLFIGLGNFAQLFADPNFINSFKVLLIFLLWNLIVYQAASVMGAYLIFLFGNSKWGGFFKVAFTVPMVVPGMVITLFWLFFYEPNLGMLNHILTAVGLGNLAIDWLGHSQATAIGSLLMMGFPWISGIGFLIYLAGFQGIDSTVREAAVVDGASGWVIFSRILLPLLRPQLRLTTILVLIGGIQQFSNQLIFTNGGPGYETTVPGLYLYDQAFVYGNLGLGSAVGVVLFFIIILLSAFSMRMLRAQD